MWAESKTPHNYHHDKITQHKVQMQPPNNCVHKLLHPNKLLVQSPSGCTYVHLCHKSLRPVHTIHLTNDIGRPE